MSASGVNCMTVVRMQNFITDEPESCSTQSRPSNDAEGAKFRFKEGACGNSYLLGIQGVVIILVPVNVKVDYEEIL